MATMGMVPPIEKGRLTQFVKSSGFQMHYFPKAICKTSFMFPT